MTQFFEGPSSGFSPFQQRLPFFEGPSSGFSPFQQRLPYDAFGEDQYWSAPVPARALQPQTQTPAQLASLDALKNIDQTALANFMARRKAGIQGEVMVPGQSGYPTLSPATPGDIPIPYGLVYAEQTEIPDAEPLLGPQTATFGEDYVAPIKQRQWITAPSLQVLAGLGEPRSGFFGDKPAIPDTSDSEGDFTREEFARAFSQIQKGVFNAGALRLITQSIVLGFDPETNEPILEDERVLSVRSKLLLDEWAQYHARISGDPAMAEKIRAAGFADLLARDEFNEKVRATKEDEKLARTALTNAATTAGRQDDADMVRALGEVDYTDGLIANAKKALENANQQAADALAEEGRQFDLVNIENLQALQDAKAKAEDAHTVALQIATDAAALAVSRLNEDIAAREQAGEDVGKDRELAKLLAQEAANLQERLTLAEIERLTSEAEAKDLQESASLEFERTIELNRAQEVTDRREFDRKQAEFARTEAGLEREVRRDIGMADIARIAKENQRVDETKRFEAALRNPYAYSAAQSLGGLGLGSPQGSEGLSQASQFMDPLSQLGFGIPEGAQAGQQLGAGQFFGGGLPTLGNLSQIDPEALQFMLATLGFTGTSMPQFGRQSGAITPGVQGRPGGQLVGGVRAGGR
jgi:hypothetical protein